MEFCPKCGAILIQKRKNDGCPRCNYSVKGRIKIKTSEEMDKRQEIAVITEKDTQVLPIVGEKCRECGNKEALFWTVQTRSGDEAETKFFKCTKCKHTWREYR
ncbi:MAG: transcription factor S [archaeon]